MICGLCYTNFSEKKSRIIRQLVSSDCQPISSSVQLSLCPQCGHIQKDPTTEWHSLVSSIYKNYNIYSQSCGEEQKNVRAIDQSFVLRSELLVEFIVSSSCETKRDIFERVNSAGSIIDIGCGNGALLKAFSKRYSDWAIFGSDINLEYRHVIENITDNATFLNSNDLLQLNRKFDVITLVHSLEHIVYPSIFLKNLKEIMHKNSLLFIQVPDSAENPFDVLVADHVSHFTKKTIAKVLSDTDYEILVCGNPVIPKEISVLAKLKEDPINTLDFSIDVADQDRIFLKNIEYLDNLKQKVDELSSMGKFGVFGSSIGGSWVCSIASEMIDFFVDEDVSRIGKTHLGKKIISPSSVPRGYNIIFPLEISRAKELAVKFNNYPWNCILAL